MTCSIAIIRRGKPVAEVKGVDIGEPLYDPRMVITKHIADQEEFDINVESTLLDLYEKVGILKERIERLENERRG